MRTAFGVWRCAGAHSPGSSNCMPRYIAALACILSRPWPGLASTSTRRSAFSIGVSSPAFISSGRSFSYDQYVARVLIVGLCGGSTPRRLGHSGTRFCCASSCTYSLGRSSSRPSSCMADLACKGFGLGGSGGEAVLALPAVEPLDGVVEAFGRAALPQVVAPQPLDALGVVDAPHLTRRKNDARVPRDTRTLVELERLAKIGTAHAQCLPESHRILERHAGALCEVLQHRV